MATKKLLPSEIREVAEFQEAEDRIKAFKDKHVKIFEQFEQLAAEYNQKLEAAEKGVRLRGVSCGSFDLYQWQTTYDAKALYDAVGREKFLQLGGILSTQTVYDVDRGHVGAAVNSGQISDEVIGVFVKNSPRYHKPDKVNIP